MLSILIQPVAGFWISDVRSIEWVRRRPIPLDGECAIELRPHSCQPAHHLQEWAVRGAGMVAARDSTLRA